jgi:hypothetical protein
MKQITKKTILKIIWIIAIVLWTPFEISYMCFGAYRNAFDVSKVGIFLSNKFYKASNNLNKI